MFIAYGVNLRVTASFHAANGLSRGPPFPPPAQRWASETSERISDADQHWDSYLAH
jgi:hypothetical protein